MRFQSIGENLDSFGLPLMEAFTPGYFLIVNLSDKDKILKKGFKPIHPREYVFLREEDAIAHA